MGKRKRIKSANGEIHLPEAIIQHIQSFLSGKEAAQTSVLSKSWYSAWLTRPNLVLDQRPFRDRKSQSRDEAFLEFAKKTMQRYEELNLKIQSLRLCTGRMLLALANELIVKAVEMGVTDLYFEPLCASTAFVLPREVLGSENLIRLSVNRCKIDLGVDGKVSCSRLKSLNLRYVNIQGDIIWDIMSSCPLIEELSLSDCEWSDYRSFALSHCIEFGKQKVGSVVVDGPIHLYEFRKLKSLLLGMVKIDSMFFHDFSSKFPCLKDLTIEFCDGYKGIKISSPSLECISFDQERGLRANFDIPSIRKFKFSGSILPSLSFKTASREWESDISIMCKRPSTPWFLRLKKCLTNLSPSKISLFLRIGFIVEKSFDHTGNTHGLPKPLVENLTVCVPPSVSSTLLYCLFWICCPKFITPYSSPWVWEINNNYLQLLCKRLIEQGSENCCIPNRNMSGLHDLEEVNVEIFEENLAEWQPVPWRTLLNAPTYPENRRKIRFQFRWGLEPITTIR